MRVTMTEDRIAAPDGIEIVRLAAGDTVDLPDELAASYLERGIAVHEVKDVGTAPENKDAGPTPENKSAAAKRHARKRVEKAKP